MKPVLIVYANSQGAGLLDLLAGHAGLSGHEFVFLSAQEAAVPDDDQLARCRTLIYQISFGVPGFLERLPATAVRIVIPRITCTFLWPYAIERPDEPLAWRFPIGDRWLMSGIRRADNPVALAGDYAASDLGRVFDLNRLFELELDKWAGYDRETDVRIGGFLTASILSRRLFFAPDSPSDEVLVELASQVLALLQLPPLDPLPDEARSHLLGGLELPVHPSIVRYFALSYLSEDTLYPLFGGSKSVDAAAYYRSYATALLAPGMDEALLEAIAAIGDDDIAAALNLCTLISWHWPDHPWATAVVALISAVSGQRAMACQLLQDAIRLAASQTRVGAAS